MGAFDIRSTLIAMMALLLTFASLGPTTSAYELSVIEMLAMPVALTHIGDWWFDEDHQTANCTNFSCDLRFQYFGGPFQFHGRLPNPRGQSTIKTATAIDPRTVTLDTQGNTNVWTIGESIPYGYHDAIIYNVSSVEGVTIEPIVPAPPITPKNSVKEDVVMPIVGLDGKVITTSPYITVRGEQQVSLFNTTSEESAGGPYSTVKMGGAIKLLKGTELVVTPPKDTGVLAVGAYWVNRSPYPSGFTAEGKWTSSAPLPWLLSNQSTSGIFSSTYRTPVNHSVESSETSKASEVLRLALNPLEEDQITITLTGTSDENYFEIFGLAGISANYPQGERIVKIGDDLAETTTSPVTTGTSTDSNVPARTNGISDSGSSVSSKTSSAGAIAGGVVGGIVGAALIASIVFFIMRRRRRQRSPRALSGTIDDDNFQFVRAGSSDAPIINPYDNDSAVLDGAATSDSPLDSSDEKPPTTAPPMFTKPSPSTAHSPPSGERLSRPSTSAPPVRERAPLRTRGVRHDEDAGELEVVHPDELVEDELLPPMYNPSWQARQQNPPPPSSSQG